MAEGSLNHLRMRPRREQRVGAQPWRIYQCHSLLLCAGAFLACLSPCARADFFNQIYIPPCQAVPTTEVLRWSSQATWARLKFEPAGVIPGVGAGAGLNVSIPCGVAVLADVEDLSLLHLDVRGQLTFEDPWPLVRTYSVQAAFVSVLGGLTAGTPQQHFRSKLTFTLLPNPFRRAPLLVTGLAYPDKSRRILAGPATSNIGHKAFAVVGGQLHLHGMPGGSGTPSWVKLQATAPAAQRWLLVDSAACAGWPPGAAIAVAPTDYFPTHAEERRIAAISTAPGGGCNISLDAPLSWMHYGDPAGLADGFGGAVDQRAEVALLSRNIVITGAVEGGTHRREGGHLLVQQTLAAQFIEGVELWRLGQQGTLGRYSLHFHVCGDTQGQSVVRKNSIHDSNQRCVVVHATHNLTVDSNVAYNTSGHCFMIEEGGEQDNTFVSNLGILTVPVHVRISSEETDKSPSTFWITNLKNHFINNVAAGSASSGIWTELRGTVRGMSLFIPELKGIAPNSFGPGGRMHGNVLHSNWGFGFRAYPKGIHSGDPDFNRASPSSGTGLTYTISNLLAYKHRRTGVFLQSSAGVVITNSTFADNLWGVYILANHRGVVRDSRFVGYTTNLGTPPAPSDCKGAKGRTLCAPIHGCRFPTSSTANGNVRSLGESHWLTPSFGVLITGIKYVMHHSPNALILNNKFSGYDPTCRPAAGVGVGLGTSADWWDAAVAIQGSLTAKGTPAIWLPPTAYSIPGVPSAWEAGDALSQDLVLRDPDGTLVGGRGGYLLPPSNTFLLPPLHASSSSSAPPQRQRHCHAVAASNAVACRGVCYRTLFFEFEEPGFQPYPAQYAEEPPPPAQQKKHGDYSYLVLVRTSDGASRAVDGNLQVTDADGGRGSKRWFYVTVLTGQTYTVQVQRGKGSASFWPSRLLVAYADGWGANQPCAAATVNLVFLPDGVAHQWMPESGKLSYWNKCPGLTLPGSPLLWPASFSFPCYRGTRPLMLQLGASMPSNKATVLTSTSTPVALCSQTQRRCGVVPLGSLYSYDADAGGADPLGPGALPFYSPWFNAKSWTLGWAPLGAYTSPSATPVLGTVAPYGGVTEGVSRTTFHFRKAFSVTKTRCYTGAIVQYYPVAGLAVHLNGEEIFRFALPHGKLNSSTLATSESNFIPDPPLLSSPIIRLKTKAWEVGAASLRSGANLLAFQVHVQGPTAHDWVFDSSLSLLNNC